MLFRGRYIAQYLAFEPIYQSTLEQNDCIKIQPSYRLRAETEISVYIPIYWSIFKTLPTRLATATLKSSLQQDYLSISYELRSMDTNMLTLTRQDNIVKILKKIHTNSNERSTSVISNMLPSSHGFEIRYRLCIYHYVTFLPMMKKMYYKNYFYPVSCCQSPHHASVF